MHPQILQCAITVAITSAVAIYVATRREHDSARRLLLGFMAALVVWVGGLGARRWLGAGPGADAAFLVFTVGSTLVPPLWFMLAGILTRSDFFERHSVRFLVGTIFGPSLLSLAFMATNPWHSLYYTIPVSSISDRVLEGAGPAALISAGWAYLLCVGGVGLYLRSAWRMVVEGQRWRGFALALATLSPLPTAVATDFYALPLAYNPIPAAIGIAVSAFFALHWRYFLSETLPVARRDVIELLTDGVIIVDLEGRILDVNPAGEAIVGTATRELHRQRIDEILLELSAHREPDRMDALAREFVSTEGPWIHEFRTHDGRFLETTTDIVQNGSGRPAGYFVVLRDMTERRRVERFLRQGQRLETVASLAAGIAHEVNNPLAYIRSNLNHVQQLAAELKPRLGSLREQALDEVDELVLVTGECIEGVERIGRVIDRMRRFSRLPDEALGAVDVNAVVQDALKIAQLHPGGEISIHTRLAEDLPPIRGSAEHLVQAVLNLLVNARQAVSGREHSVLEIETRLLDDQVEIGVHDDGPGIPKAIRNRIFDPFFTTKGPGEGTGLGLAISFGIAREHHGALEVDSQEDAGTRIRLLLPVPIDA